MSNQKIKVLMTYPTDKKDVENIIELKGNNLLDDDFFIQLTNEGDKSIILIPKHRIINIIIENPKQSNQYYFG